MSRSSGILLEPGSGEPLFKQIFDQVVERIRSSAFPPGYQLPPTRTLAQELSTHRNTVVRAYADLEAAGFISSTVGKGTFVNDAVDHRGASRFASDPRGASRSAGGHQTAGPALATGGAAIPWSSLLSRVSTAESLTRGQRLSRPAGKDLINLNRMQPSADLMPDDLLRRCMEHVFRSQGAQALGYAPAEGLPRLRGLIAQDLVQQGVPARAEDILVTTGSQQGLDLLARALVNPGDAFLVDPTTYTGAINLLTVAGARLVPVPTDGEGPDLAVLKQLGGAGAKGLYLMPNCHNPTGASVSAERRHGLVAWSRQHGVPLIEDDYGADLILEGETPPALRALDGDVVHMGTFSKKLMPALRVGFVVCPQPLRPALLALKHAMDLGTSALLQHALAEFLERGYLRAHLNRTLPEYRARRDALEAALREHLPPGLSWKHPQRGVVLWLPLPRGLEPEQVYEEARRRGVLVSPSTVNAVDPQVQRGIRLTFCAEPPDRTAEGGRRLGEALRALLRQQRGRSEDATALEVV